MRNCVTELRFSCFLLKNLEFSQQYSGWESAYQYRWHGFNPSSRGIPRATKPVFRSPWARVLQLLKPVCQEPTLCSERGRTMRSLCTATEEPGRGGTTRGWSPGRLTLPLSQLPRPGGSLREQRVHLPLLTEYGFPSCSESEAVGSGQVQMACVPESITSLPLRTGFSVRMEVRTEPSWPCICTWRDSDLRRC